MEAELNRLETQLEQLIALYMGLRSENLELRTEKARLEAGNHQLQDKVSLATEKLETLLASLPQLKEA
jgi:chromosome segregation ATPase